MYEKLHDSHPEDKGHEHMPDVLRGRSPKDIALIHMVLQDKGYHLLGLPQGMHWHAPVSFGHISLPENQVKISVTLVGMVKGIVQGDSSDIFVQNHVVEGKLTSTVISNKAVFFAARLGHCMNRHTTHCWQQVWPKKTPNSIEACPPCQSAPVGIEPPLMVSECA